MKYQRNLKDDANKLEVLRLHKEGLKIWEIVQETNIPKSTVNDFLLGKTHLEWWAKVNEKPIAQGELDDHRKDELDLTKTKTFIITSAQNNTYVHRKFLQSLEVMAADKGAQIIVGTFTYNQSGFQNIAKSSDGHSTDKDGEMWFDPKITDYIMDQPAKLAEGLLWCGELNILPTAVNPLSGLASYTKTASGIVPHAKVQLESIPTHKTQPVRMMYTTGTVTKRNYIQKKSGQKASFHHVFGALLVEVDKDGDWFVRQLISEKDTGCFFDMDKYYTPHGVMKSDGIAAINYGDLHSEKKDEQVYEISFGKRKDSLLNLLKPQYQFIHDGLDFEARNHHNISDPYFRFKMHKTGKDSVQSNIADISETLARMQRDFCTTVVVESNHDTAFQKWLKTSDYKTDPENALYFLENQLEQYRAIERGEYDFSIFEYAVKKQEQKLKDAVFLKTDESFKVCDEDGNGIECGQHGHLGSNGSRGGIGVYQKMGTRYNIGHSHTAGIKDGVYQAGVSAKLDMGYNCGASSWSQSHIITYKNGKRTIITLKNGKHSRK